MRGGQGTERNGLGWWLKPSCWEASLRTRDKRNSLAINGWCAAWALCFVGATAVLTFIELSAPLSWLVVAVPLVPGFLALRAYLRFLREADELLRKIHLEGLGFGAGTALAVGMTFLMIIPLGASAVWGLTLTLTALALGYSFSVVRATRNISE